MQRVAEHRGSDKQGILLPKTPVITTQIEMPLPFIRFEPWDILIEHTAV